MLNWKLVNFCEYDKYASQSYCAIHNVSSELNLGDITKVDEKAIQNFDLMTWGFPCQSISVAGKQKGFIDENGEKTNSGLYYDGIRILREKKPKISIIENVKNLTGNKFKNEFNTVLSDLETIGYNSYWAILNGKDYGIPQHRERVFIVSIRKDIDNGLFHFPQPFDNGIRLKNLMDDNVDKRFFNLKWKTMQFLKNVNYEIDTSKQCLGTCHANNDMSYATRNRVYNDETYCPTLSATMYKDPPKIFRNQLMQIGYINDYNGDANRVYDSRFVARTLKSEAGGGGAKTGWYYIGEECIRKLTPIECFRLMGFTDEDYNLAKSTGISETQLYKQAGNSIITNCLFYIYVELYKALPNVFDNLTVSSFFSGIGAFEKALDNFYKSLERK